MNKTNFLHAAYAVLMQAPFLFAGYPWVGAAFAVGFFISREHAHRQVDIAKITGVVIVNQNPLKGFLGWSKDAKLDAALPAVACLSVAWIYPSVVAYVS